MEVLIQERKTKTNYETSGMYIEATRIIFENCLPDYLLSSEFYENLTVFLKLMTTEEGSFFIEIEKGVITIFLPKGKDPLTILSFLAHEIVHVRQYLTGDLEEMGDGTSMRWKGNLFLDFETNYEYNLLPWEVEAFQTEKELLKIVVDLLIEGFVYGHESI